MRMNSPWWRCEKCDAIVEELFYCAECWKVVCEDCYDPFVGVCKDCIRRLFKNIGKLQKSEVETKCCPSCGLVAGRGYSWIGHSFEPPREDHSIYFPIDNSRW